jgi:hypothetical protein
MLFADKSHLKSRSFKILPQNFTEVNKLQLIELPEDLEKAVGRSVLEGPTVTTSPINLPNSSKGLQRREVELIRHDLMTVKD